MMSLPCRHKLRWPFWALLLSVWIATQASANDLRWRISVKMILDANGDRSSSGSYNEDSEIQDAFDLGNEILIANGSPFSFDVVEIVDLPDQSQWFDEEPDGTTRADLETAAKADKTGYLWRDDAVNVYVVGSTGTAFCQRPGGSEPHMFIMGQSAFSTTPLHEAGHIFGLCHTHGCISGASPNPGNPCGGTAQTPISDLIADTVPDNSEWDIDEIACFNFGDPYADITPAEQDAVDDVFRNVMAYHEPSNRNRFTTDQMDVLCVTSNLAYDHAASGYVWFVNGPSVSTPNALVMTPEPSISNALALAQITTLDDVIVIRGGNYPAMMIDQEICLRASRGDAVIGQP